MSIHQRAKRSLQSAFHRGKRHWDRVQVELHGSFSSNHVKVFEEYAARTSTTKALLICLWTPVPVILMTIVIESIPTEDPATCTARQSPFVWLRVFTMSLIASRCYVEQFRQHVPLLRLARSTALVISITGAIVSVAFQFFIADQFAYPFPFSVVLASMVWAPALSCLFFMAIRKQLHEQPQLVDDMRRHISVCVCQFFLISIYPLYNAAFQSVSAWKQTAMVFLLPIIKLVAKNWISHWISNAEEARAEAVIFNVDVFHALYVSYSMQNSSEFHTVAAIMALDFLQAWVAFADMAETINKVTPLTHRMSRHLAQIVPDHSGAQVNRGPTLKWLGSAGRKHSQLRLMVAANTIHPHVEGEPVVKTTPLEVHKTRANTSVLGELDSFNSVFSLEERAQLTRDTQKLLFISEFIALVEFTEVFIPLVFSTSMAIMFYLPNRQFHGFLQGLTVDMLYAKITNISLYALLELASLVVMAGILWHKLRVSMLHQLAFVLENRQASVQVKVVMWAMFVMQTDTQQSGVDYTFKFAWLKTRQHT